MTGLIAKLLAYVKYPRRTFLMLHPIRAAKFGLAYLAGRRLFGDANGTAKRRKRRRPPRRRGVPPVAPTEPPRPDNSAARVP